jgi:hypothetical protein
MAAGEPWTYDVMNDFVKAMKSGKPIEGCKEKAWWQLIPLTHYLVPLLHTLIGIGNDLFDNFKDIVNEKIECLDPKEIQTRRAVVECEKTIAFEVSRRDRWDVSDKGKKVASLKGVIYRRKVALGKLGVASSPSARTKTINADDIDELLKESDEYVESEDVDDILALGDDAVDARGDGIWRVTAAVQVGGDAPDAILRKITEYQSVINEKGAELRVLLAERKIIEDKISRGRKLLGRLKKKLTDAHSCLVANEVNPPWFGGKDGGLGGAATSDGRSAATSISYNQGL